MFHRPPTALRAAAFAAFLGLSLHARAAEDTVAVPRSEWEALKREMADMHRELKELKAERASARPMALAVPFEAGNVANAAPPQAPEPRGLKAPFEALSKSLTELVSPGQPGTNAITITGEAAGNWRWDDLSKTSGFDAVFSPEFHWDLTDRLSFDAKLVFSLNHSHTFFDDQTGSEVLLDLAHLNWQVADQFTLILGKFRSPINAFAEKYDYTYIYPLTDAPLGLVGGVLPESNVGVQLRGDFALPYEGGRITTAAFVANAPRLLGDDTFDFPDLVSGTDNYAVGGHLGWQVCPHLEIGYGLEYAKAVRSVYSSGEPALWLHSLDLQTHLDALRGRWRLQAQYGWSELDRNPQKIYHGDHEDSFAYSTHHHAGYVQLSYRGHEWKSDLLNHLEFIARGDRIYFSGAQARLYRETDDGHFEKQIFNSSRLEENRFTFGLDYWITDFTALKASYEYWSRYGGQQIVTLGFATGL